MCCLFGVSGFSVVLIFCVFSFYYFAPIKFFLKWSDPKYRTTLSELPINTEKMQPKLLGQTQLKYGYQKEEYDESSGFKYLIYRPEKHKTENSSESFPLLVFLHGAGESGDGPAMEIITEGASGCPPVELFYNRAVDMLAQSFIVVSPRSNYGWSEIQVGKFVRSLLHQEELQIDSARVYLTGVSMGGAGVWASAKTGYFAAIAPVCGYGQPPTEVLADVGVWVFHGKNDVVVPVAESDAAISTLRKRFPGKDIRYTRYETSPHPVGWPSYSGHASWLQAYGDKDPVVGGTVYKSHHGVELFSWFLSHKKMSEESLLSNEENE